MCKILKIEDLENSKSGEISFEYNDFIKDIDSKKPIKALLKFENLGELIKVTGHVEGFATLTCDLCLEPFEYELNFDIDELFAKQTFLEDGKQEVELKENSFITDLRGKSEIDVEDLLYQSVILDFPNKKVCDINCKGGDIFIRDEGENLDPRMSIFKNIKTDR